MYTTIVLQQIALIFFVWHYSDAFPDKICKIPNGQSGTCTVLKRCDPLYELDRKRLKTPAEETFFRQSVASCGSRGAKIKVCCPPESQWGETVMRPVVYEERPFAFMRTNESLVPNKPLTDHAIDNGIPNPLPSLVTLNPPTPSDTDRIDVRIVNFNVLEEITEDCGIDAYTATRIVGGEATEIDEYPWLALLEYEPKQFSCGGSLISRRHVLTAAHCLITNPTKVRLSEYNITSEPTDEVEVDGGGKDYITVTIVGVARTFVHPDYVRRTITNDVGLVKMDQDVQYGDFIKPICLPTRDYQNTHFTVTSKFTVAGWGNDNMFENSEVKRSVLLPYVPYDICVELHNLVNKTQQICAGGEKGKDSCRGDSGGPLMYEDPSNSKYILVGIVSSGPALCGTENAPGIYTNVYSYVDWIKQTMSQD